MLLTSPCLQAFRCSFFCRPQVLGKGKGLSPSGYFVKTTGQAAGTPDHFPAQDKRERRWLSKEQVKGLTVFLDKCYGEVSPPFNPFKGLRFNAASLYAWDSGQLAGFHSPLTMKYSLRTSKIYLVEHYLLKLCRFGGKVLHRNLLRWGSRGQGTLSFKGY